MTVVLKNDADSAWTKAMHGGSTDQKNAFFAMLNKNSAAHRETTNEYVRHWKTQDGADATTEEAREERKSEYMSVVNGCVSVSSVNLRPFLFFSFLLLGPSLIIQY